MICILAGNRLEAERFASSHLLESDEWFYPKNENELRFRENFHVLVVGGMSLPEPLFNKILNLAKERGKRNRR